MRKSEYRPSLTREDFEAALRALHSGSLPKNMDDVINYIRYTTKEFQEFTLAVTECAVRMGSKLEVMEKLMEGKTLADVPSAPQWVGPSAELVPGGNGE